MPLMPQLLEILVCPKCKGDLEYRTEPDEALICHACRLVYRGRGRHPHHADRRSQAARLIAAQ